VAQPKPEPLRRWDPERIGPYVLLGRLGAGAMGQVYLGRSTAGRMVAVKTIKIELAEEAGFRDHFAHEVAAARRVSGMFTAAVVAADPEADVPWLATAYLPAPSLRQLVRSCGPQPVETIWWLAAGCAEALESIHGAGLVHRDLKPSNVLVAPDGPRVIDFGVARAAERIQLTVTRGAVGTPAYMAPEQARDTRQASMASDVFALGGTLLFAATGHAPYQGETVMDILVRLATEPPDLTGLPAELTEIVTACLERSPRARPTSAALLARLGPLVAGPQATEGDREFLTGPAMALIAEYQHSPRYEAHTRVAGDATDTGDVSDTGSVGDTSSIGELSEASGASGAGEDGATYASHTALAVPAPPRARRWAPFHRGRPGGQRPGGDPPGGPHAARQHAGGQDPGDRGPGSRRPGDPTGRPRRRHGAALSLAGRAALAVLLIGAGAFIGSRLSGPRTDIADTSTGGKPRTSSTAAVLPLPGPGGPAAPPSAIPSATTTAPAIALLQQYGDGNTVFVVHGTGWPPGIQVSVALAGHGVSPARPVVDPKGTFNYAIDQGHLFFRGPIPEGTYRVVVTGPGARRADAVFRVIAPPPPGPPQSGPPPPSPRGASASA
jgi:serine/threonine protein kinase